MTSKIPETRYQKLVESYVLATLDVQKVLLFYERLLVERVHHLQAFAGLHEQGRVV